MCDHTAEVKPKCELDAHLTQHGPWKLLSTVSEI